MVFGRMKTSLYRPAALDEIVDLALREPVVRSKQIVGPNAERLWLRRAETQMLYPGRRHRRFRQAFDDELRGLRLLADAGMPVPEIRSEGPDHYVISDAGISLQQMLNRLEVIPGKRTVAFRAAGAALGRMHRSGFAHGHPTIRNICWDGDEARFLDLWRVSDGKASIRRKAFDLIVFVHSFMVRIGKVGPDLDVAIQAYRAATPETCWANLQALGAWIIPLSYLIRPLGWLGSRSPRVRAALKTQAFLRGILA